MRKKYLLPLLIIFVCACLLTGCTVGANDAERVAEKGMPPLLELSCVFQASESSGTAIIVDERGYAVTNAHVVTNQLGVHSYTALSIKAKLYGSTVLYDMTVVAYDIVQDIAVLKFEKTDLALKQAVINEENALNHGNTAYAIGNSMGYGLAITKGIISAPSRRFDDSSSDFIGEYIQFDAAVSSGASGGALLNEKAQVVGMISFRIKSGISYADGMGFAIPSRVFMDYFRSNVPSAL